MKFIQMIEYKTSQPEEVSAATDEFLAQTEGKRAAGNGYICRHREKDDHYVNVIVFPSYAEAMRNNQLPETQAFAEKMTKLCDGDVTFHNLDVVRAMDDEEE